MIVYCDATDCKSNDDRTCVNRWTIGTEAIKLSESSYGMMCTDYEERDDCDSCKYDHLGDRYGEPCGSCTMGGSSNKYEPKNGK